MASYGGMAKRAVKQRKAESEAYGGVANRRFTGDHTISPGAGSESGPMSPDEKVRQKGYKNYFGSQWRRYFGAVK